MKRGPKQTQRGLWEGLEAQLLGLEPGPGKVCRLSNEETENEYYGLLDRIPIIFERAIYYLQ